MLRRYLGGLTGACIWSLCALSPARAATITYEVAGSLGGYVKHTYNPNPLPIYQQTQFELNIARGDLLLTYDDMGTASATDDVATIDGTTSGCFGFGCDLMNIGQELWSISANLATTTSPFGVQFATDQNGDLLNAVRLALLGGVIWKTDLQYELDPNGLLYNWSFGLYGPGSGSTPGGPGGPGTEVPEPATMSLLGAGLIGLACRGRRTAQPAPRTTS